MAYSDFDKFKAFFLALNRSNYHPERMDPKIITPQDKAYCFNWLLKEIPELKGKNNNYLIEFLRDPKKVKSYIAGKFTTGESAELTKTLEEKPAATEGIIYQQGQEPTEQPAQGGATGGSSTGSMPFGMPAVPSMPSMPRAPRIVIRNVPQAPKPDIAIANSRGDIIREQPIKAPSRFSNFGSKIGRGIAGAAKSGLETANPFLGRMGNRLLSGLEGIAKPGGIGGGAGGSRSVFSRFGRGGLGGTFSQGGGKSIVSSGARKWALGFGVFFLIFGLVFFSGINGTTPTGEAAPPGTSSLDYTLPLKDASIQPLDIKDQVKAAFPGAKLEYWDKVIQRSKDADFNPALALALWIEETGASQTTLIKNGGSEIPVNGNLSKGHLGCAPWEDQTIDESLTCLFKFASNYTNDQFAQFMAAYSGGPADNPFSNNPYFPANIKTWYSKLVPSGAGALTAVVINPGNFNVNISALPSDYQQWAQEALNDSTKTAPKFEDHLNAAGNTKVVTTSGGSHTEGTTVFIKTGYNVNFFKQIFIHELGHRIKGVAGTPSPACNGQTIESIESEGYLTYYAEHATPAQVTSPACGNNDQTTRSDEDFAESVSYYINSTMGELNYGSGCITYNSSLNPYARGDRPAHKAYIQCLLGP